MTSQSTTSPPSNPFSSDNDEGAKFDAFSLSPSSGGGAKSSSMPSLQSIQQQEQQQQQMQQQQQPAQPPQQQEMKFDSLPSPEELSGPMNDTSKPSVSNNNQGGNNNWPPPSSSSNTYGLQPNNTNINNNQNNNNNQSFLTKLLTCGGLCSIETLRPYFDIDTADIFVRMKGSIQYVMVMNGFRNEVLYSDNAFRLAYRDTTGASEGGEEGEGEEGSSRFTPPALQQQQQQSSPTSSSGKGPDLYGPIWITLTLVFFVAVTSNISLYIHHTHKKSIVDEGGIAAEEEWDYDINQLLHATWILYSFLMGLPTLLYFMIRLIGGGSGGGGNSNLGLVEMICLYGYSLVPYLPVTWICIVPYGWVQWLVLSVATVLSGMLVLRNVAGSVLDTTSGGGGGIDGLQGKKGGSLLMCIVGFHLIFLLVMKLAFYHHHS